MRIVVLGGTGLIGSKLVTKLDEHGHDAVSAGLSDGVNTVTGDGLHQALQGADVVVDVTNSPSFDEDPATEFFTTATGNILRAEAEARVGHHVALSVVGTERIARTPQGGYFRAKLAQERLIQGSGRPYSLVHATQFFEFAKTIADVGTTGSTVRVSPVLIQPMAADDVAAGVGRVAVGEPANGIVEIAGPDQFRLPDFLRRRLAAENDPRDVLADPTAGYFGMQIGERDLIPGDDAHVGQIRFEDWLRVPSNAA
jgi:uncharacterized protein YbjT (DUF2867 family)